jgi:hypothetical protein
VAQRIASSTWVKKKFEDLGCDLPALTFQANSELAISRAITNPKTKKRPVLTTAARYQIAGGFIVLTVDPGDGVPPGTQDRSKPIQLELQGDYILGYRDTGAIDDPAGQWIRCPTDTSPQSDQAAAQKLLGSWGTENDPDCRSEYMSFLAGNTRVVHKAGQNPIVVEHWEIRRGILILASSVNPDIVKLRAPVYFAGDDPVLLKWDRDEFHPAVYVEVHACKSGTEAKQ